MLISGPMIGGNLSNPGTKWPEFGAKYPIFKQYVSASFLSAISQKPQLPAHRFISHTYCRASYPRPYRSFPSSYVLCSLQRFVLRSSVNQSQLTVFIQTLPSTVAKKQSMIDAAKRSSNPAADIASYGATLPPGARATGEIIDPSEASTLTLVGADPQPQPNEVKVTKGMLMTLLSSPHVRALLASGFMFNLLGVGLEVVFILYSYTSIDLGGMGRSVCDTALLEV